MAEAKMNNGQTLLAFNDFFIGPSSHVSARYKINFGDKSECQSSSGIIVSTGAGATGWLSSLMNMSKGFGALFDDAKDFNFSLEMDWEQNELIFMVREPFKSKYSQINLIAGCIESNRELVLESLMPSNGVIFSDGIEADYLQFNSGSIVNIGIAKQKAMIIQNSK